MEKFVFGFYQNIKYVILLFYILVALTIGCDDGGLECKGNLFSQAGSSDCLSETLISLGSRGIGCEQCASDLVEDFSLSFEPAILSDGNISTILIFRDDTFVVEPKDCNSIELFEATFTQTGLTKRNSVGLLEELQVSPRDNFEFIITINNQNPEHGFCDFCWVGPKPACENN